ncbi:MAG: hypothetical protein HY562_00365 [Ignavibacteriales bacterium]|nr:hypothetical protein [Ignavibacteriales bacterium]
MERLRYLYKFNFPTGQEKHFEVILDAKSLELLRDQEVPKPDWTKLKFSQCSNCPLGDSVEHCPVAVNLSRVVETFRDNDSFEQTTVTVETPQRTYTKNVQLQKGISSLIGMIMVTSNCPIMDRLRPMARFHLPFATSLETFYRTVSMYLTAQYLLLQKGEKPDWDLTKLLDIYKAISHVNKGMSQRLVNASNKDANVNAVVILHSFGDAVSYLIEDGLSEIKDIFGVYVDPPEKTEPTPSTLPK